MLWFDTSRLKYQLAHAVDPFAAASTYSSPAPEPQPRPHPVISRRRLSLFEGSALTFDWPYCAVS
ncbi:hypothetical protein BDR04DRAFT_1089553 [Suillus decipiens]|nr:hypothetical protein BDR04DRAFT_1089553 [Suillus decipiens]